MSFNRGAAIRFATLHGGNQMDWVILLLIIAIASWWLYRKDAPKKLATAVMRKWVEMAQHASAAEDAGTGAAPIGKSVTVSDFRYDSAAFRRN